MVQYDSFWKCIIWFIILYMICTQLEGNANRQTRRQRGTFRFEPKEYHTPYLSYQYHMNIISTSYQHHTNIISTSYWSMHQTGCCFNTAKLKHHIILYESWIKFARLFSEALTSTRYKYSVQSTCHTYNILCCYCGRHNWGKHDTETTRTE